VGFSSAGLKGLIRFRREIARKLIKFVKSNLAGNRNRLKLNKFAKIRERIIYFL
jgi:hypothetical protein